MELVQSNVSSTMTKIYEAHWETGNEVHSKIGKNIAYAQRIELLKQRTKYRSEVIGGKRIIKSDGRRTRFGRIVNKQGEILETRLHNLIQWRTYSTTGTTVVAAPMKSGRTEIRRDGKIVGSIPVSSVGKGSIDILQKLNYGLNSASDRINIVNKPFDWQGKESMKRFKGTHTKARLFMETGRRNAMSKNDSIIREGFANASQRKIEQPLKAV